MEEISFEDYCRKKKIDPELFLTSEPLRYQEWKVIFEQVHPDSFTEQKKFLINPTRKKYLLVEKSSTESSAPIATPKLAIKIPPIKKED